MSEHIKRLAEELSDDLKQAMVYAYEYESHPQAPKLSTYRFPARDRADAVALQRKGLVVLGPTYDNPCIVYARLTANGRQLGKLLKGETNGK